MRVGKTLAAMAIAISLSLAGGCDLRSPRPKAEARMVVAPHPAPDIPNAAPSAEKSRVARTPVSRELVPPTLTEAERRERNIRVFALFLTLLPANRGEAFTANLGRGRP